jgi:sulfite reductase (NADPH) hemoprotein beta-component
MYRYNDKNRQMVRQRAAQFRWQLERWQRGELSNDDFRPLRLQNGWYVQRHAPMLRVAVPYGELSSHQLRQLARIAREFDAPGNPVNAHRAANERIAEGYGHFTTRQNIQFNWIPLDRAADVMDLLAEVDMHGIQTSGNCIRNITSDAYAGIAPDEDVDPRPWCELLRQWSTLHPEFAFLPRKFKIAVTGAADDRAAIVWHDIGLRLRRDAKGKVGFEVHVGGGMGRTPVIATLIHPFVPWTQIKVYLEAIVRTYNRFGRRDNMYKARIKILVKAEGQRFVDEVNAEFDALLKEPESADNLITQAELDGVLACFAPPPPRKTSHTAESSLHDPAPGYRRWLERNVRPHRDPALRAVTLSFKRPSYAPGDATASQLDAAAELADRFSCGEARVTHQQNLLLPWVHADELRALWHAAKDAGFATANIGLLTDMIACPGGDFCALANARSIPVATQITERFADAQVLDDIGDLDLHISGCINSCGHHHSGHIGVLGVDKDGAEWYQLSLGGSDGRLENGTATPGRIVGKAFAADEIADAVDAALDVYLRDRQPGERFIDTVKRLGLAPFKEATDRVRHEGAEAATEAAT